MGVEPTADVSATPAADFEDRDAHRDASAPRSTAIMLPTIVLAEPLLVKYRAESCYSKPKSRFVLAKN